MKLNLAAICQNDLHGNDLEINLLYSAYLLARARKRAFWGNVSAIVHTLFVFAGGWGWVIYGIATHSFFKLSEYPGGWGWVTYGIAAGIVELGDVPRLVWLSIVILPLVPFLLDIVFAIIEKLVPVRKCIELLSDGDLSENLSRLEENLKKANRATAHEFFPITYYGMMGFTGVTTLFVLWVYYTQEFIRSSGVEILIGEGLIIVCTVGFVTYVYSAILLLGGIWLKLIFRSEKDSKNISQLRSSYPAYAEKLRFEALTPEEQHRILEEKKREEEERVRREKEREKERPSVSMVGWTWSPTDTVSSGGLTSEEHDILDDLGRASLENWSKDM